MAHLLNFDSVHGIWAQEANVSEQGLLLSGHAVSCSANEAMIVIGVNHTAFDANQHAIVTGASCTTSCLAASTLISRRWLSMALS